MSTPRRLALDASVRRADVDTARGTFAALICARSDSSLPRGNVVMVPGFTGSKEDFAELLPLLAEAGWRVATYDQRGQYETPGAPDDDLTLAGFAADLLAVAEAVLGAGERAHLVGHSLGGLVASTAAIEVPQAWASLTLMCSGPGGFEGPKAQEASDGAGLIASQGLEAAYETRSRRALERGQSAPSEEIERFLRARFMANSPASLAAMARMLATTPDLTQRLVAAAVPVAVLRGAEDDAWSHDVQEGLADALGTSVVVIEGAAHSPAVESPEQTRDALARIWMSSR